MFERLNKLLDKLDKFYEAIGGDPNHHNITEYERYENMKCAQIKQQIRMEQIIAIAPSNISYELSLRKRNGIYKYDDLITDDEINKLMPSLHKTSSIEITV